MFPHTYTNLHLHGLGKARWGREGGEGSAPSPMLLPSSLTMARKLRIWQSRLLFCFACTFYDGFYGYGKPSSGCWRGSDIEATTFVAFT